MAAATKTGSTMLVDEIGGVIELSSSMYGKVLDVLGLTREDGASVRLVTTGQAASDAGLYSLDH